MSTKPATKKAPKKAAKKPAPKKPASSGKPTKKPAASKVVVPVTPTILELPAKLTDAEKKRKADLEVIVRTHVKTFVSVGLALVEIRDSRLYREEYDSFEEYTNNEHGIDKSQAYRLMGSSVTAVQIAKAEPTLPAPASERSIRPLAALPKEDRPAAYKEAVAKTGGAAPTSEVVQKVVDKKVAAKPAVKKNIFTDEEIKKDDKLAASLKRIGAVLGPKFLNSVKDGTIDFKRQDCITLSAMKDAQMKELEPLLVGNRWSMRKASAFLADMPTLKSTVADLVNYCLSGGGKYEADFGKFRVTISQIKR